MIRQESLIKSLFFVIPYIVGLALSSTVLPQTVSNEVEINNDDTTLMKGDVKTVSASPFQALSFAIHRNGEASPCGSIVSDVGAVLTNLNDARMTKYQLDNELTNAFSKHLLKTSCGPETAPESIKGYKRKTWGRGENYEIDGVDNSFLTFCDMGEEHTPILHDHNKLVPIKSGENNEIESLPCHFHTREGLRITSMKQLSGLVAAMNVEQDCSVSAEGEQTCDKSKMMHLYAVPAGRIFMFAPSFVGEIFTLSHVHHPDNPKPVTLEVLSVSPKVLDVINFFEEEESKSIVKKALNEKSESHRIKRSSTGASGYNVNSQRTSENGFDTHGEVAIGKLVVFCYIFSFIIC